MEKWFSVKWYIHKFPFQVIIQVNIKFNEFPSVKISKEQFFPVWKITVCTVETELKF